MGPYRLNSSPHGRPLPCNILSAPKEVVLPIPLGSPFYPSCLLLLVVPCAKQGLCPPAVKKGIEMGIRSRPVASCQLYNYRLCCAYLPIIQSVIVRCMYVQNISEPLVGSSLPRFTWGSPCGWFVSPVYPGCMCRSWKSLCGYFCSISVSSPRCVWDGV